MADNEKLESERTPSAQTKRPKGSWPPKLSLSESVGYITQLYERAGGVASLDELSEIMQNSRKSSAFVAKAKSLKSYGLILPDDEVIQLSTIGNSIAAPEDQSERTDALKRAFLQIDVFKIVYEKFLGKLLPQDEFLKNSFNEFGGRDLAESWMLQFKNSAQFAGLLMDRGDGKYQVRETASLIATDKEVIVNEPFPAKEEISFEKNPVVLPLPQAVEKTPYQFLIEILDSSMEPDEQQAVWTLIQFLKKKDANKG